MKIGWLVYDDEYNTVEFHKEKPRYSSGRWVQIVYHEVIEDAN